MKKLIPVLILSFILVLFFQNLVLTNDDGPGAGVAASPFDGGNSCANASCHGGTLNSGTGIASITSDIPVEGWTAGHTYTISATVSEPPKVRFGFQALAGYDMDLGSQVGTINLANTTETQIKNSPSGKKYVTHKLAGNSGTDSRTWTFFWGAPPAGAGDIGFYGAFVAANNNGSKSGDLVYTSSLIVNEMVVGLDKDSQTDGVKVYPTLCGGELTVDPGEDVLREIRISDLSGREVYFHVSPHWGSVAEKIDLSGWPNGYYVVSIGTDSGNLMRKILKY